ncbi:hypothetical protein EV363DRAFT_1097146, partial [Boletus edulis]
MNPTTATDSETTKAGANLGRPKAGDYDAATRTLLQTAIQIFCSILLTDDPFPSTAQEEKWALSAWEIARSHHKVNIDHNPALIRLITARTSHLRGQFKARARSIVMNPNTYSFLSGQGEDGIKGNRALVAELKKASAFIYVVRLSIERHVGIYANPAIQQVINEVLFKHANNDGIRWARYYSPFPRVGFALTLTVIECAIDEWAMGVRQNVTFRKEDYSDVFTSHMNALNEFDEVASRYNLLPTILQQVFDNGCAHAGIVLIAAKKDKQAVPSSAFVNAMQEYE